MDNRFGRPRRHRLDRPITSLRIADELLRATLAASGAAWLLDARPGIAAIHGVPPADAATLKAAAREMMGEEDPLDLEARDWTEPERLDKDSLERLLLEASVAASGSLVLFRRRSHVPRIISTMADAVVPLADRRTLLGSFVMEIAGFAPDDDLVARLARLPLPYCNLILRPGLSPARMRELAKRLRRYVAIEVEDEGSRKGGSVKSPSRRAPTKRTPKAAVVPRPVRPERLEHLPGMGEAGLWGLTLAADLAEHQAGRLSWDDIENGVVLFGPPGTGKTLFAQALAGSCGVPLHAHSVAAWQARGHLGDMLKAMRAAFADASKAAPCILFVDELDSVGSRDEDVGDNRGYQRQVVNAFLECLDGSTARTGVVVVGATNNPAAIDLAILRPGRLGRQIRIELPDLAGRAAILRHHLREDLPEADLDAIANEMGEASGAALAQLVREARAAARRERRPLAETDLWAGIPKGTILSEEAFRRLCVHEAGHVVVGQELATVSGLVPTGARVRRRVRTGLEHKTDFKVIEGFDVTRAAVMAQVAVHLAGAAAEEVLLGSRGDGSGGSVDADLVRATRLVTAAERSFGLGEGLLSVPLEVLAASQTMLQDPLLRRRAERSLTDGLAMARAIVERRRPEVEALASRLNSSFEVKFTVTELPG